MGLRAGVYGRRARNWRASAIASGAIVGGGDHAQPMADRRRVEHPDPPAVALRQRRPVQVKPPAEAQAREREQRLEGRARARPTTGPISTNAVSRATLPARRRVTRQAACERWRCAGWARRRPKRSARNTKASRKPRGQDDVVVEHQQPVVTGGRVLAEQRVEVLELARARRSCPRRSARRGGSAGARCAAAASRLGARRARPRARAPAGAGQRAAARRRRHGTPRAEPDRVGPAVAGQRPADARGSRSTSPRGPGEEVLAARTSPLIALALGRRARAAARRCAPPSRSHRRSGGAACARRTRPASAARRPARARSCLRTSLRRAVRPSA